MLVGFNLTCNALSSFSVGPSQETKEEIGTIVDVHSSGANDLLRVCLASTINRSRDVQVWIPFVKEIVPLVDKETRRVEITPPAGLLELNVPKEGASKKEIRKQVLGFIPVALSLPSFCLF